MKQTTEEAAYDYATEKVKFRKDVLKEVDADSYVSRHADCMEDFHVDITIARSNRKEQSPWISVEDKLPPVGVDVLHTDMNTGKRYYGQVNKVGTLILGWTPYGEVTATHYMLIPPLAFDEILNEYER